VALAVAALLAWLAHGEAAATDRNSPPPLRSQLDDAGESGYEGAKRGRGEAGGGGGTVREALAQATARVREADAAARALQAQAAARLPPSSHGADIETLLSKAARFPANATKHTQTHRQVRIHNASRSRRKFRQTLQVLEHALPAFSSERPVHGVALQNCGLRRRPKSPGAVAFMHIGKSGGTALRSALLGRLPMAPGEHRLAAERPPGVGIGGHRAEFSVGRLRWRYTKRHKHEYGDGDAWELHIPELLESLARAAIEPDARAALPCLCTAHFDFSLIEPLYTALPEGAVAGLALVRDPVDRLLSHFYHAQRLEWTAGLRIRELSPLEFLGDPEALLDALMVWQDGVAGVSWWAGDTVHFGMGATGDSSDSLRLRSSIQNRTETLRRAVRNYERFVFVGLLEQLDASLVLLAHALGWRSPPRLERLNAASPPWPSPGPKVRRRLRAALRVLAPMDMWFYEFVKSDFHERLAVLHNSGGIGPSTLSPRCRVTVVLPSEEQLGGCVATRGAIACGSEVFAKPGGAMSEMS